MTQLFPKLNKRVQILIPTQKPEGKGGFNQVYGETVDSGFEFGSFDNLAPALTVWMECMPITWKGAGTKYIRGEQVEETSTHIFTCRRIAVATLGKAFTSGFSDGFDSMADLIPLKGTYYLLMQADTTYRGRLFKIDSVTDVKECREYLKIKAEEIEEWGTGHPS